MTTGAPEGARLMAAIACGEVSAFEAFYDRHASSVHGLALYLVRDRGAAEEITQDAFLAVWRRADSYRPDLGSPRAWLLGIARNRAIDHMRASRLRREEAVAGVPEPVDGSDAVAEAAAARVTAARLAASLPRLPSPQRAALALVYLGGCSHEEAARRSGVPLGTLKSRVRLGLARLRRILDGLEPPQAAGGRNADHSVG